jgi:hypothetical protein
LIAKVNSSSSFSLKRFDRNSAISKLITANHCCFAFLLPFVSLVIFGCHIKNQGNGSAYFEMAHQNVFDLFVFGKTLFLYTLVTMHFCISTLLFMCQKILREKSILVDSGIPSSQRLFLKNTLSLIEKIIFSLVFLYFLQLTLSTFVNDLRVTHVLGFYEHYEGFLAYFCSIYVFIFFTKHSKNLNSTKSSFEKGLLVSSVLVAVIGFFQYFGFYAWELPWFHLLTRGNLPAEIQIKSIWGANTFSSTLFNPNWAGFYFAVLCTWVFSKGNSFAFLKPWQHLIWYGILTASLSASGSRTSFIALSFVLLILTLKSLFVDPVALKIRTFTFAVVGAFISSLVLSHRGQPLAVESTAAFSGTLNEINSMRTLDTAENHSPSDKEIFFVEARGQSLLLQDSGLRYRIELQGNSLELLHGQSILEENHSSREMPKIFNLSSDAQGNHFATLNWKKTNLRLLFRHDGIRYFLWGKAITFGRPTLQANFLDDHFASNRGYIWKRILPMALESPWFGHGPDAFANVFPQNDFSGKLATLGNPYILIEKAHNMYLAQLVNGGFPQLILFSLIFIVAIILGQGGWELKAPLLVWLIGGLFNDSFAAISVLSWAIAGLNFRRNPNLS